MEEVLAGKSLWTEAWGRLRRQRRAMLCLAIIALFVLVGLTDFIPAGTLGGGEGEVAPRPVTLLDRAFLQFVGEADKNESYLAPPAGGHLLGTDIHGVDVLYKTAKGVSTALVIGGLTAAIYIPLGLFFGLIAGYFGGLVDDLVVYLYSTLACIPGILLLIALMMVMDRGVIQLCLAMGLTGWVGLCRLIRGETMKMRESEYILAARALGAGSGRIIVRHLLPNLLHLVIITFTLGFSGIVMYEAVLSYIGIGVGAETISWGKMIAHAKTELIRQPAVWWQLTGAAGALFALVLSFNIFGDALRDALDPKLKGEMAGR